MELMRARLDLDAAITEAETVGEVVPCAVEPRTWDGEGSPRKIAAAMFACDTCPVAALCAAWVDSGADVHGVVAGAWRQSRYDNKPLRAPRQVQAAERLVLDALGLDRFGQPVAAAAEGVAA